MKQQVIKEKQRGKRNWNIAPALDCLHRRGKLSTVVADGFTTYWVSPTLSLLECGAFDFLKHYARMNIRFSK